MSSCRLHAQKPSRTLTHLAVGAPEVSLFQREFGGCDSVVLEKVQTFIYVAQKVERQGWQSVLLLQPANRHSRKDALKTLHIDFSQRLPRNITSRRDALNAAQRFVATAAMQHLEQRPRPGKTCDLRTKTYQVSPNVVGKVRQEAAQYNRAELGRPLDQS